MIGCWVHARRKVDEALKSMAEKDREVSHARRGKQYCDRLFMLKRGVADMTAQDRYKKRQELSKPLLEELYQWAATMNVLPKSATGKAKHYLRSQR